MSYVDAKRIGDLVYVAERNDGKRRIRKFPAPYFMYEEDDNGSYTSMYGKKLARLEFKNGKDFRVYQQEMKERGVPLYESDVKLEFKLLEKEYADVPAPELQIALADIEVDYDPETGWARPENPYAPINAVTIRRKWLNDSITIGLCPPTLTIEEADELMAPLGDSYIVVDDEAVLLEAILELLEDADIISGWNSEYYDLPYLIARIRIVLGGESYERVCDKDQPPTPESEKWLTKLCLFGLVPTRREVERYGKLETVWETVGRVHLDYLSLYQKFTFEEKHSYTLDYILQEEINQRKVPYEGSLRDLYYNDFKKFLQYNRQDVDGLSDLDDKLKFVDLANQMAHMACVMLPQTLGSVAIIEQAVLVQLHKQGFIGPDKDIQESSGPVAGAFVKTPPAGIFDWICSFDINSLYPSVIRMLNISPERVIGQFDLSGTMAKLEQLVASGKAKSRTEAWHHFTGVEEYHAIQEADPFRELTLVFEDGTRMTKTGAEWNDYIKERNWSLTANGTVFDTSKQGILPFVLEKWYTDRKAAQKRSKDLLKQAESLADKTSDEYKRLKAEGDYWNRIQHCNKITLNSLYGALLNAAFRFGDPRFGQSVTLSGRVVTKHMMREAANLITGKYDFTKDTIYGDTDSVAGDSIVETNIGPMTIEELFERCSNVYAYGTHGKERARDESLSILTYDPETETPVYRTFDHVYRHKVKKSRYRITGEDGRMVEVTGDHSIMVKRDGELIGVKPSDLVEGDELITI